MPRFVDAAGTAHERTDASARIVSLVPSITELLFHLGLGDRVVGRTSFCVHPATDVSTVPRVGGTKKLRLDRIRQLGATHAVVNVDENDREQVAEMGRFVPNVIVTHPLGPLDNLELYRLLGGIFGCQPRGGRRSVPAFEQAFETVARAASALPSRRVLYLIWRDPWMTVSSDTYISRTLALVRMGDRG